jgi:hypothetical protein
MGTTRTSNKHPIAAGCRSSCFYRSSNKTERIGWVQSNLNSPTSTSSRVRGARRRRLTDSDLATPPFGILLFTIPATRKSPRSPCPPKSLPIEHPALQEEGISIPFPLRRSLRSHVFLKIRRRLPTRTVHTTLGTLWRRGTIFLAEDTTAVATSITANHGTRCHSSNKLDAGGCGPTHKGRTRVPRSDRRGRRRWNVSGRRTVESTDPLATMYSTPALALSLGPVDSSQIMNE